ncbi:phage major capsid protein [Sporolactobacillus shoreae]|uniref:Phage major capsid protein n=1 Tax=Sporolactobacillus shoreae TaxID=1465501 RepID=A0A4Z0GIN1_9BACL|nr:phage major capsid protein [Sporolactobacillus shoreae]TGA95714.1 phage major capsid protein [Sporolactobacillus shoreae]
MNIEQLRNAWIAAGQKVVDAQEKVQQALLDDEVTAEQIKDFKAKLDAAKAKRDMAKEQLDEVEAEGAQGAARSPKTPVKEPSAKEKFVTNFKALLRGREMPFKDLVVSDPDGNDEGLGLTIPPDIETQVFYLIRQYDALQQYVDVRPVTLKTGSLNLEKWRDITPFADLDDETATIGANDDPNVKKITWEIHRHAGISAITNTLLKDSPENIIANITAWLAKKEVVTRNAKILAALAALPSAQDRTLTKFDDIKDAFNTGLDPALHATTTWFTNQSGFNVLDKVKDAMGNYLIQKKIVANSQTPMADGQVISEIPIILGRPVKIISDRWLPNGGTTGSPVYPLYVGDMKETVKLFDREQLSLLATNIGAGSFETDQTKLRAIDRFDVELWDTEAMLFCTFTGIADQQGHVISTAS